MVEKLPDKGTNVHLHEYPGDSTGAHAGVPPPGGDKEQSYYLLEMVLSATSPLAFTRALVQSRISLKYLRRRNGGWQACLIFDSLRKSRIRGCPHDRLHLGDVTRKDTTRLAFLEATWMTVREAIH